MKRTLFILLAAVVSLCGCEGVGSSLEGQIQLLSGSKDKISIKPEGGWANLGFSSALDWSIRLSEEWLKVNPAEGGPGNARISIGAEANESSEAREGVVYICTGNHEFPIVVTQDAFMPTLELLETEDQISCLGGELEVNLYADVEYDVHCEADWVTGASTKAPGNRKAYFNVAPNPSPESRTTVITFSHGALSRNFTLTQRPAGTEQDDWKYDDFVKRSLAMRFTATWCGYCPMMATGFSTAKSKMAGALEVVNFHGGQSDYEFLGTNSVANRFRVQGYPTGVVDCRATIPNFSATSVTAEAVCDVAKETQASYPAVSGIALKSRIDGTNLTVDLSLYLKEADAYKVTMLLLEDGIIGYQNGAGSNYSHDDIARHSLTLVTGDPVQIDKDGTVWNNTYTATVRSGWKTDNLKLLVYVERPYGDQQRVMGVNNAQYSDQYGYYGDTYLDNCRVVKVGAEAALELR